MAQQKDTFQFGGCEFATFQPKDGVTAEQLVAICHRLESEFLSHEKGFIAHMLLQGNNGLYADMVLADTQDDARRICAAYPNHAICHEHLQMIDEESTTLTFWKRLK